MTKNKHDHTATKKIKAWLFAIMLLLPFLFLLPTGLYYGLNQNAQLSERTEQQPIYYQSNEVQSIEDINFDNVYRVVIKNVEAPSTTQLLFFKEVLYTNTDSIPFGSDNTNSPTPYLVRFQNNNYYYYYETQTSPDNRKTITNTSNVYYFDVLLDEQTNTQNGLSYYQNIIEECNEKYIKETNTITYTNDISTSIINAWNSTWQNPLFSWTSYSPFYTPMQSFTNVFGINNMQIANVLTYLATITAIYIVFDIVIELFTYLTHLIPRSD